MDHPKVVFQPDDPEANYSECAKKWWQWILGIESEFNPILDTTGQNCHQHQTGPIWFLATSPMTVISDKKILFENIRRLQFRKLFQSEPIHRRCSVPHGKDIFFPVLNYANPVEVVSPVENNVELVHKAVSANVDTVGKLEARIDQDTVLQTQDLLDYKVILQPFEVMLPKQNFWEIQPGLRTIIAGGYWLRLRPLSEGKHDIYIASTAYARDSNEFTSETYYHLTIGSTWTTWPVRIIVSNTCELTSGHDDMPMYKWEISLKTQPDQFIKYIQSVTYHLGPIIGKRVMKKDSSNGFRLVGKGLSEFDLILDIHAMNRTATLKHHLSLSAQGNRTQKSLGDTDFV
jgi:hypothetical protein